MARKRQPVRMAAAAVVVVVVVVVLTEPLRRRCALGQCRAITCRFDLGEASVADEEAEGAAEGGDCGRVRKAQTGRR